MVELSGVLYDDAGVAISGAAVAVFATSVAADESTSTGSAVATTTTNSLGVWAVSGVAEDLYDVRVTTGSTLRWRRQSEEVQVEEIETSNLLIRNPANTFVYDIVPAAIAANRTLNLPLITGTDTLVTLGLASTFTANLILNDNVTLGFGTSAGEGVITSNGTRIKIGSVAGKDIEIGDDATVMAVKGDGTVDLQSATTLLNVGASGNDWTQNALSLAGGTASQLLTVKTTGAGANGLVSTEIPASGTGSAGVLFVQGDGSGAANNMRYDIVYDGANAYLKLTSRDTDGASADADIWRVADGGEEMILNANHGTNFDFVCDGCGRTELATFECCGLVTWHDDVPALRERFTPAGLAHLVKIGVMVEHNDSDGRWVGMNMRSAMYATWDGMWQTREMLDGLIAQLVKNKVMPCPK